MTDFIKAHEAEWAACEKCPLCLLRDRAVLGSGAERARVLVLGFHPGMPETRAGVPFAGGPGRVLRRALFEALGHTPVYFSNVLACPSTQGNPPTADEIEACAPRVEQLLAHHQPEAVVFTSAIAASHWGGRLTVPYCIVSINDLRHLVERVRTFWSKVNEGQSTAAV